MIFKFGPIFVLALSSCSLFTLEDERQDHCMIVISSLGEQDFVELSTSSVPENDADALVEDYRKLFEDYRILPVIAYTSGLSGPDFMVIDDFLEKKRELERYGWGFDHLYIDDGCSIDSEDVYNYTVNFNNHIVKNAWFELQQQQLR